MARSKSQWEIETLDKILDVYPEMKGKSKSQRVREYIERLPMLPGGFKLIGVYAYNRYKYVNPNLQWGGLEDITESHIMAVANKMGYRCSISNFGGVILRPKTAGNSE